MAAPADLRRLRRRRGVTQRLHGRVEAMTVIGYHASHEQHRPSGLVAAVRAAADAGLGAVCSSDHVTPWSRAQGESGFAWSFAAALDALALLALSWTGP